MMDDTNKPNRKPTTRRLKRDDLPDSSEVGPFRADPPDQVIPWVIDMHMGDQMLQVQVRAQMIVGRGSGVGEADIDLTPFGAVEAGVSQRHAIILARSRFLTVRDMNSTNGTYLNDVRVPTNQDIPLEHSDRLRFGSLEAQLMFAVLPPHTRASASSDYETLKPTARGSGQHVLVVEDDEDVAQAYQMMLRTSGYRVTVLHTRDEAVGYLSQEMPDALVVDITLNRYDAADMSGLDVLFYFQDVCFRRQTNIPVIVVSGITDDAYRRQAINAGATLVLPKPVRVDELAVRIGMLLQLMGPPRA
jgi:CheY-like chemotaxis protein